MSAVRKKSVMIVLAFMLLAVSKLNAGTGVGAQFGVIPPVFNVDLKETIAVTLKLEKIPFVFSLKLLFTDDWHVMGGGATADMWLANPVIGRSVFRFFYGIGADLQGGDKEPANKNLRHGAVFAAPRFFGGINCLLTDFSELYAQIVIEPGVVFDEAAGVKFKVLFPIEAGLRLWF